MNHFGCNVTSTGYMLTYRGRSLGGAGTLGTATHTSDGRRRSPAVRKKDCAMYRESAEREIAQLERGAGGSRYRSVMAVIDQNLEHEQQQALATS